MATTDEIRRRVELADAERSNRRLATAQLVGELAHRRTVLATELSEVDVKLGELITEAEDVMSLPELASFTDVPVDELTKWTTASKPKRGRKRRAITRPPKVETSSVAEVVPQALRPATEQ
ncbi:hypothetical protein SAMN05216188_107326 [Lentzea xinjiangensis]|uniref:Uncharacterized protein n=1 Tax=Lentzea xinjiangensis TaxID=402600 RepID=A0A1H9L9N7_9PSEU|nr:hypothetical protein [Lentzea xinjiangensis]SER08182.1 hypothetical protein SAMN05216188_107326 [Lentzea xinjiangensis]